MVDWLSIDALDPDVIRSVTRAFDLGAELEVHQSLPSTMDRVREAAADGCSHGFAVLAEEQTAGRGRQGRAWHTPAGHGIALSVFIDPMHRQPGALTLSLAVAVRDGIVRAGGPPVDVKWPNDLELGGRKVCGILVEALGERRAAVGIGINVHPIDAWPDEVAASATCLDIASDTPLQRNVIVARVLEELEAVLEVLGRDDVESLLDRWRKATPYLGVRVRVKRGGTELEGVAFDVDGAGALLVRLDSGEVERILAGTVRVVR